MRHIESRALHYSARGNLPDGLRCPAIAAEYFSGSYLKDHKPAAKNDAYMMDDIEACTTGERSGCEERAEMRGFAGDLWRYSMRNLDGSKNLVLAF